MSINAVDDDQKPKDYGPPFDDSDADVVLRSSDLVDFYLYKLILAKSSPVFRDMFSVPQPASDATGPRNLPIIPLSETAADLAMVLTFCFPVQSPPLTVQDAGTVLRIAEKYAMDWLYEEMKDRLKQPPMARIYPISVFGLAWELKLEDVARVAAKEYLRMELTVDNLLAGEELEFISGSALQQLATYHRACADMARRQCVVQGGTPWVFYSKVLSNEQWSITSTPQCSCTSQLEITHNSEKVRIVEWWASYVQDAARKLDKQPWPALVLSPELIDAAHQKASQCGGCRGKTFDSLPKLSRLFSERLEACISQVRLDLPFSQRRRNH